jgi:hypothetical protein
MDQIQSPYRAYDVLDKWDTPSWDHQTRDVIHRRLSAVPQRRFFSEPEWRTLEAVVARLLPQPERANPIPITPWIDEKLQRNQGDGFRYDDMPPLDEAWRLGLAGIEQESEQRFGHAFPSLASAQQDAVLRAVQQGETTGAIWERLPPRRFFATVLLKEVVAEYYSHPDAWSEVGFGGPASPRGYVRLGLDEQDPWEAQANNSRKPGDD